MQTKNLIQSQQTKDLLAALAGTFLLTVDYVLSLIKAVASDLKTLTSKGVEKFRWAITKAQRRFKGNLNTDEVPEDAVKPVESESAQTVHRKALGEL
ncbi:MAG: hypothetical protein ABEK59_00900 [Halobacteria archaeon]